MIEIRAGNIMESLKIKVKGLGAATARARVGRWIFQFGAIVAGCAIEIEMDDHRT